VFMMTHVVTDTKRLHWVLWALVLGALLLGVQAYLTPYRGFSKGRLEGVGGADFSDANRFGGYMAGMLFLAGAQFMRSRLPGRALAFLAGGFIANAVVLTRSRGAFLGVMGGMIVAVLLAPRHYRAKILTGVLVAGIGGLYLSDPQFLRRIGTIDESEQQRDTSAQSRLEIWQGGLEMLLDHPLGVGPGNFYQNIGRYAPLHPGRDAHNTFVRCAGELGFPGLILLGALIVNAFSLLRKVMQESLLLPNDDGTALFWAGFGVATGLSAMLVYGMTGTLVYTEYLWWMLGMPVCLARVLDNTREDSPAFLTEVEIQA